MYGPNCSLSCKITMFLNWCSSMNYKKFIPFGFFILIYSAALAQNAQISLTHTGYGQTQRDAVFSIRNTGDIALTNITISIDGQAYTTLKGVIGPEKAFMKTLNLEPGQHLIEISTPEKAYDSLRLNISGIVEKPSVKGGETKSFLQENMLYISAVILVVIFVIVLWFFTKKPKLDL